MESTLNQNECFIATLAKLKASSREAVESSKSLSDFKKYMHITREVQKEFEKHLLSVAESSQSEIIFLCGSVGDGKSHILSYYNENMPEIMSKFTIHNDSTASFYKNRPAIDTLIEVLDNFSDEKIEHSNEKLILAINLGTLNNFVEADEEQRFTILRDFISESKILEDVRSVSQDVKKPYFQFVNFADYHLYSLSEGKAKSSYLEELLDKIVAEDSRNVFDVNYKQICLQCDSKKVCPVKANFELLRKENFRTAVINVVIEAVIKNKLIVSTRALYDFIYELIVDSRYINAGSAEPKKEIAKLNELSYCEALLINNLYSRSESSELFEGIHNIDPLHKRNEELDSFIINYHNRDNVLAVFEEDLPLVYSYLGKVNDINFNDFNRKDLKQLLLKLFIRGYYLDGRTEKFLLEDKTYLDFVEYLYYWNKGQKNKLKGLYNLVKEGALHWNGDTADGRMNIYIGKAQTQYVISETVDIKPSLDSLKNIDQDRLLYFSNSLILDFKDKVTETSFRVDIDFTLYELLAKIVSGYRPNLKDKKINIKFNDFVDNLIKIGSKDEVLFIREKNQLYNTEYRLEYNEDFGYTFEVI